MSDAFLRALSTGARALSIDLRAGVEEVLARHYALVERWSRRMNLTTIHDPIEAANLHALDSLLFAEMISAESSLSVVDVGSGAGFPGIPVALVRPRLDVVLLEPARKRASFLRNALATLPVANARVVEGRLCAEGDGPWPADVIVSRATLPPAELIAAAAPRLVAGGCLIVGSGARAMVEGELEAHARDAGLVCEERRTWTLPGGETRVLDRLRRC